MSDETSVIARRPVLQSALGLAVGGLAGLPANAEPAQARPGDFDFLAGEWRISHRRLKPETGEWDEFTGEATCWTILNGVGSVEELRIPARNFAGMGLRLLELDRKIWSDFWVNAKSGVLTTPGMTGLFQNGEGVFEADEMDGDQPIKVRGVWDRITPAGHRWHQAISHDSGKTWQVNWTMDWVRA